MDVDRDTAGGGEVGGRWGLLMGNKPIGRRELRMWELETIGESCGTGVN